MRRTSHKKSQLRPMHVPDHANLLPEHVDPIPMPDTEREAEMLLLLLEAGFCPKCKADRPDESGQYCPRGQPSLFCAGGGRHRKGPS